MQWLELGSDCPQGGRTLREQHGFCETTCKNGETQTVHKTMRELKSSKNDAIAWSNDAWQLTPNGFAKDLAQPQCATSELSIFLCRTDLVEVQHEVALV